jgi:leader peptidase (prepilin peptidase)/N-methyltransferase
MDWHRMSDFLVRPLEYPLTLTPLVFILGAMVGSLLNVCIYRMPLEKSLWWPGSTCGNCYQKVWKRDNIPLLSYLWLGGRCRTCGQKYSSRYFWIELLTATMFAVTFWFYLNLNVAPAGQTTPYQGVPRIHLFGMWAYHVIFLCFLLVATFTDFDHREIPLRLTIPGAIIGILGGTLGGWPWPIPAGQVGPNLMGGMQHWPFWIPADVQIPFLGELEPGSWKVGLLTSLIGALAGTAIIRTIRGMFSWALEKEAMGLGDADLLMLIGAFLGWQALVFVLGYAIALGLVYILVMFLFRRGNELPFGPSLAGGAVLTLFDVAHLHEVSIGFFFNSLLVAGAVLLFVFMCFNACLFMRFFRVAIRPIRRHA